MARTNAGNDENRDRPASTGNADEGVERPQGVERGPSSTGVDDPIPIYVLGLDDEGEAFDFVRAIEGHGDLRVGDVLSLDDEGEA